MQAPRVEVMKLRVYFGECDPAGIVFFPNFIRWFDASSRYYFDRCGVPSWHITEKTHGIIGTPVVEINTRFLKSATYGEELEIHTSVVEWHRKVFVHRHVAYREGEMLAEAEEKRLFVRRDETGHIRAVMVPEDFKAMCA